MTVTAYLRDKGVICYAMPVWEKGNAQQAHAFARSLLESQLDWYWESERRYSPSKDHAQWALPKTRPLTNLAKANSENLVKDCLEQDESDDGRYLAIIGCLGGESSVSTKERLQIAMRRFAIDEEGPIKIVISQPGDMAEDYIFVPHKLDHKVKSLLALWGLKLEEKMKTRKYQRLRIATLESIFEIGEKEKRMG